MRQRRARPGVRTALKPRGSIEPGVAVTTTPASASTPRHPPTTVASRPGLGAPIRELRRVVKHRCRLRLAEQVRAPRAQGRPAAITRPPETLASPGRRLPQRAQHRRGDRDGRVPDRREPSLRPRAGVAAHEPGLHRARPRRVTSQLVCRSAPWGTMPNCWTIPSMSQFVQPSTIRPAGPKRWIVIPVTVAVRPVGSIRISSPA